MIRYLTAGESHGPCLVAVVEGLPAGLRIDTQAINDELRRRQQGYGRGERMRIEHDQAEVLSGIKNNVTIGSPLSLLIKNRDHSLDTLPAVTAPRPGHADLAGAIKYGFSDIRCVLERASARETAARVAAGSVAKLLLAEFSISVRSRVLQIGGESEPAGIRRKIDAARRRNDTLGGIFEVRAEGVPAGLGSYVQYDRRLDARLAAGIMSIPGIKGVEFGMGFAAAAAWGSQVHDAIFYSVRRGFFRRTNRAGGVEGGVSNGMPLMIRCAMKPIATLGAALPSVDLRTKRRARASYQRSDTAAVEAAGVVAEAVTALVLADALTERCGNDQLRLMKRVFTAGR
jgi:chorismate synthase